MSEVSVTLKLRGKDEPWLVFRGTAAEVKAALIESFNLDTNEVSHYTLGTLTHTCQSLFNAYGNAVKFLGATPVSENEGSATTPETEESESDWLLAELANCQNTDEVKSLWATNRPAFEADPNLDAAMKKRWAELKESK